MSEAQVESVQLSIKNAEHNIDLGEALQKLVKNASFKKVILEGYFEKEASRVVLLKAEPSMDSDKTQKALDDSITSIGGLRQYFRTLTAVSNQSKKALQDYRITLDELRNEGAGE